MLGDSQSEHARHSCAYSLRQRLRAHVTPGTPATEYEAYNDDLSYKWIPNNRCGYSSGRCWGIRVMSKNGCPNGLYAEVNIVNGNEVVDYANDSLGSLSPGYVAKLDFFTFRENPNLDAGTDEDRLLLNVLRCASHCPAQWSAFSGPVIGR